MKLPIAMRVRVGARTRRQWQIEGHEGAYVFKRAIGYHTIPLLGDGEIHARYEIVGGYHHAIFRLVKETT
ncbi:MAG: hypothetical protein WC919_00315 [Candidatus Paceibacterota bacterium]|jgi:hypothetical protein